MLRTLSGHSSSVNAVAVTPDSKRAISGSDDNTLKVWHLETGEEVFTLNGHSSSVNAVAVTPDSKRAISGSDDTILKVWHLETGEEVFTLKLWNLETGEELFTLNGHRKSVLILLGKVR